VLQNWAREANVTIIGLERPGEQLGLFDDIPLHQQVLFAKIALQESERVATAKRRIIHAYLDGDLEGLLKTSLDGPTAAECALNDRFVKQGIFARNRRMVNRLRAAYARGNLFVAVGALHLPGQQGLVSLLRGCGYDMSPIFF